MAKFVTWRCDNCDRVMTGPTEYDSPLGWTEATLVRYLRPYTDSETPEVRIYCNDCTEGIFRPKPLAIPEGSKD